MARKKKAVEEKEVLANTTTVEEVKVPQAKETPKPKIIVTQGNVIGVDPLTFKFAEPIESRFMISNVKDDFEIEGTLYPCLDFYLGMDEDAVFFPVNKTFFDKYFKVI